MSINKLNKTQKNFIFDGIDSFNAGFFVYKNDETQRIIYSNRAVWKIFECESDFEFIAHVGGSFKGMTLSVETDAVQISIDSQIAKDDNFYFVKYRIRTQSGNIKYVECYGHAYENDEYGKLIASYIIAKTEEYDQLTGLPEKKYFLDNINSGSNKAYNACKRPAIISFNLNGFKMFNTRYSIKTGDELLIQFAGLLIEQFDKTNCSRFDDDHFFAICEADDAAAKSNAVFDKIKLLEYGSSISCRAGIFIQDPDSMVYSGIACEYAQTAADHITQTLASQLAFFDEDMKKEVKIKNYILSNLDSALKNGYIKPFYQAQVNVTDMSLNSFEALARWNDPDKGLILPGYFVPILEEYGLMSKIDIYIIEQAAIDMTAAIEKGFKAVPVSFNLSFSDFAEDGLYDKVVNIINKYELSRNLFKFELIESTLILAYDKMKSEMQRFRDGGFEILIDHFGGNDSSLNTLLDFEFDEIKIDMTFMRKFNERSKAVVRPMIIMAKSLGIRTLAEGVETQEQLDFLKAAGCEQIQGYYYSPPLPFEDIIKLLKENAIFRKSENNNEERIYFESTAYKIVTDNTEYKNIIAGLGSAFSGAYVMDLETNKYHELFADYLIHSFIGGSEDLVSGEFVDAMSALSTSEYINEVLDFTEIRTLPERLKNKSIISCNFVDTVNHQLMRASFIVLSRLNGKPSQLLFTTRNLSETERNEGEFKKIITAYANVCFLMIQAELVTYQEKIIFVHDDIKEKMLSRDSPGIVSKRQFIEYYVSKEYQEKVYHFVDIPSIGDRLWNKDYICLNYRNHQDKERRIMITPLQKDNHGNVLKVVISCENIDSKKNLEAEKEDAAEHDALTGVLNREAYKKYSEELKLSSSPIAYILMDINHIEKINTKYGMKMGDHVLRRFASLLKDSFSFSDYIFRLGGDEFGVLLPEFEINDMNNLTEKIEKINKALTEPEFDFPKVSISAGIAVSMNGFKKELFRKADVALYQAKNSYSECCYSIFESSFN